MNHKSKKFIIITSIFNPTKAVKKFSRIRGWQVVVVGDKKTALKWSYKNVIYLSPNEQLKKKYKILKILPWNHYARKMIGYLYAIEHGAEIIYDTDDDNIPLVNWHEPKFHGEFTTLRGNSFVNIYSYFTDEKVWPRGFPLQKILSNRKSHKAKKKSKVGIWQFLANCDPDVDAIYRLTNNTPITFKKGFPLVLEEGTISPINSQNTFFCKESFSLLYLPAFVNFRFTDILRGIVAQPILWSQEFRCGFDTATVVQKRNRHDYMKDFESELPVYLYADIIAKISQRVVNPNLSFVSNLIKIYRALKIAGIVPQKELRLLQAWVTDVTTYSK